MADTIVKTDIRISPDTGALACPSCGSRYLHHVKITSYDRYEDEELVTRTTITAVDASVVPVENRNDIQPEVSVSRRLNPRDNPSMRRHGLRIEFDCEECLAAPQLTIAQDKGQSHMQWEYRPD